jgi:sugar (pentulose or hexulose) kinase
VHELALAERAHEQDNQPEFVSECKLVPRVERSSSRRSTPLVSGLEVTFPLVFNEGGAKSDVWRRIITDVFGVPSTLIKDRTGAPLGDAMLAGVAVGVFPDFSVAKERARYVELLEPDDRNRQIYQEFFDLYKSIYSHVQDDFKSLQSLLRRTNS